MCVCVCLCLFTRPLPAISFATVQWETPYIPVLPAHLAPDCMSNPVPFLYGVLTSYAARSFEELSPEDSGDIVLVDTTAGHVEVGTSRYLQRHVSLKAQKQQRRMAVENSLEQPSTTEADVVDEALRFPEPLAREFISELQDIVKAAQGAVDHPVQDDIAASSQLQGVFQVCF